MSIIAAERLTRSYGRRIGIDAVDLRVGEGEIFGFLGPNGAGKTTTIRLLLGFLRPSAGGARIGGLDCWHQSQQIKRDVGYMPGDLRLYPWLTGRAALKFVGRIRGVNLMAGGLELAERFRLKMSLPARKMSRGMRQKLGLILALVHKPRLLILDEPTSGLDPLMQTELADCLRELASRGHSVFFSSHTLSEVGSLCDRVAIVRSGRIIADETLDSLRAQAGRTVLLSFSEATTADSIVLPDFLTVGSRNGKEVQCELDGPARPLVRWAAEQPIEDISIGPPDLESLFRAYYRSREEPK